MSDSNRVMLGYAKESTYGTAPGGTWDPLRITSESLHQETSTITSAELRSDRQIPDVVRSNISVAGDTSWELSYDLGYNRADASTGDLFRAALMADSTWAGGESVVADVSNTIDVDEGNNKLISNALLGEPFEDFVAGQWVQTKGFTNAVNNGYFKILSVDSLGMFIILDTDVALADETSDSCTVKQGEQILNGTTQESYSIERLYEDIGTGESGYSALYTGMMVDGMSLAVTTEAIVTGGFSWIGSVGASGTTATGTVSAAGTNDVLNAIEDVDNMMEGSTFTETAITAFNFSLANNLRSRLQVGTLGAVSIGSGTLNVTGTFQRYYTDASIIDKYLNFNDTNLAISLEDVDGNGYVFEFPKVVYTSAQRVAGGQNQDIIADVSWECMMHDTELKTVRFSRWTA